MKKYKKPLVFVGTLSTFYETGMEEIGFCLDPFSVVNLPKSIKSDKELLYKNIIEEGDHLTIFDDKNLQKIISEGTVIFEKIKTKTNLASLWEKLEAMGIDKNLVNFPEYIDQPFPKGIDVKLWIQFIDNKHTAKLVKKK